MQRLVTARGGASNLFFFFFFFACANAWALEEDSLFYAVQPLIHEDRNVEIYALVGSSFSDPYQSILSGSVGASWLCHPFFSFGAEVKKFTSSKRQSTQALEDQLRNYGYETVGQAPRLSTTLNAKVILLSGLMNLFSAGVVSSELAVIAKAGFLFLENNQWAPSAALALETQLGFSATFAVAIGFQWSANSTGQAGTQAVESTVGASVGPVFRF